MADMIGAKSERIELQRLTSAPDGAGGRTAPMWTTIGEAFASMQWLGGGEADRQGAVRETIRYRFTVWSNAVEELRLTVQDRIVWNGDVFNIRERPRRLPAKADCDIVAEGGVS